MFSTFFFCVSMSFVVYNKLEKLLFLCYQAGIDTKRLYLALEPEVASIWCQTLKTETKGALSGPGTKYMVVDLGGISLHNFKINVSYE